MTHWHTFEMAQLPGDREFRTMAVDLDTVVAFAVRHIADPVSGRPSWAVITDVLVPGGQLLVTGDVSDVLRDHVMAVPA